MDQREAVVLLASAAATALVFLSAFVVIPRCSASVLRHWCWDLHDEIVDDVRSGRIQADEDVRRFLRRLHVVIVLARRFTMLDVVSTYLAARSVQHDRSAAETQAQVSSNPNVVAWERRFTRRTLVHAVVGSPSGWVLTPLIAVLAVAWLVVRRFQNYRPTRQAVADRVLRLEVGEVPPVLAATSPEWRDDLDLRHACLV